MSQRVCGGEVSTASCLKHNQVAMYITLIILSSNTFYFNTLFSDEQPRPPVWVFIPLLSAL